MDMSNMVDDARQQPSTHVATIVDGLELHMTNSDKSNSVSEHKLSDDGFAASATTSDVSSNENDSKEDESQTMHWYDIEAVHHVEIEEEEMEQVDIQMLAVLNQTTTTISTPEIDDSQ
ncbi:unnamed protein product [Adineta ricciae]|uniref:Uncharacterized protein n=1 Tax=Adineta ricciae TaxID=249248 RepID=A0A815X3Z1_ADIRI|nr:unnamed protein product [Adineta ricciae]CAF1660361.1 unnamed protein product [Adineta ricciae]